MSTRIGVAYGPETGNAIRGYRHEVYGVLEVSGDRAYVVHEGHRWRPGTSPSGWITVGKPLGGPAWTPPVPFWHPVAGFQRLRISAEHRPDGVPLHDIRRDVPDPVDVTYRLTLTTGEKVDYRVSVHSDRPVQHWDGHTWTAVEYVTTVEDTNRTER